MNQPDCHCSWLSSLGYQQCLVRCRSPDLPSKPMPYIGLYIAAASLICCIAITADVFNGFRQNKLWIPGKYFTINAATLTVLAVAMKLPMDITTEMSSDIDVIAKYGGSILIITAMANFLPSLGSMNAKDILQNTIALGILVITLSMNIIIQMFTSMVDPSLYAVCVSSILFQFTILISAALSVTNTKAYLELKYHELHKTISNLGLESKERPRVGSLRKYVKYYWVMAETGNPYFVMARSVTCFATASICILNSVSFYSVVIALVRDFKVEATKADSVYKRSTCLILVIQVLCITIGTIPPGIRTLCLVINFNLKADINHLKGMLKIEEYWSASLNEWKHRPLALHIQNSTCRKIIQNLKMLFLNLFITIQIIAVVESKIILFISYILLKPFFFCFCYFLRSKNPKKSELEADKELVDLKGYVLLLEGDLDLPHRILKAIHGSVNQAIQIGGKQQTSKLLKLLSDNSFNLNSLMEFDNDEVLSIHPKEPPRCWSLSIASLTCIAVALSTIRNEEKNRLLHCVSEGFAYARLVEKNLDMKCNLENVGTAADFMWEKVELKKKWLDKELQGKAVRGKNAKEVLEYLTEISKGIVMDFQASTKSIFVENHVNWPVKVIAANSMYRVSKSLLLRYGNRYSNLKLDDIIFKKIVAMIADIFSVCLTNIPYLIRKKCYSSAIERRQSSVKEAAQLFGATEEILKLLEQQVQLPTIAPADGAPYIDEWRVLVKNKIVMGSDPTHNDEMEVTARSSDEILISMEP